MKTIQVSDLTIQTLIEGLQTAVNVCKNVDSKSIDAECSYPYATGYSRSAMEMTIQQLQTLIDWNMGALKVSL